MPGTASLPAAPATAPAVGRARRWAVGCGVAGVLADLLLLGFLAVDRPWSASPGSSPLGTAADVAEAVQFAAFVPVVAAVHRRLGSAGRVRAAGTLTVASVAVLQVLLVAGAVPAAPEAAGVLAAVVGLSLWLLAVGLRGHRTARLPRAVTRCALLLAPALPVGAGITGAGLLTAEPVGPVLVGAGGVIAAVGWLALPVFPLLFAARLPGGSARSEEVP